jgi:Eco57I restriction endonuclease.
LRQAISYLAELPSTHALVDETSPLWLVTPSGDAATRLLDFWRERDEAGDLVRDLHDETLDTRFLGDLYQYLSEEARSRYALLQTPVFVEEFILDRTLEPALKERPLDGFRLIDPTCGSGHFLLGAFARLLERWERQAPGMDSRARVQKALDAIHGVDLNPYAIAVTRFRLTIAALQASGDRWLEDAPSFAYHLAVGDSLLHGLDQGELDFGAEYSADRTAATFVYPTENLAALQAILENGRYDVVVGNPPYITVKDKALNQAYRDRYHYCKGTYALTVPFMERFFDLAKSAEDAGWVGQITSNSFMKREFGAPLIEKFLSTKDLRLVVDSEGAWIPGHNTDGTPTVIIVGFNRRPQTSRVRAVLSKGRREGRANEDEGKGPYWTAIVNNIDDVGFDNEWVSVVDLDRALLAEHPWSLSGGGAIELMRAIGSGGRRRLSATIVDRVGFASFPGADDAFFAPRDALRRDHVPTTLARQAITGDVVRDWSVNSGDWALVPYDESATLVGIDNQEWARRLWPLRATLASTTGFGGVTKADAGDPWWGWYRWVPARYRTPLSMTYAEVATHNHFVLDRGGKVFNRTAPVLKLSERATENDHLALLGVLNSSLVCFWLKERTKPKGGAADQAWLRTHQFNATNVEELRLPESLPLERGRRLDRLAQRLAALAPQAVAGVGVPSREMLAAAQRESVAIRGEMIAQQEELDWETYQLYELVDEDLTYPWGDLPALALGERAFEIVLARRVSTGEEQSVWFARHGSTPLTEIPVHWPAAYRDLVERRIALIQSHPYIRLLERPEYKRRWATEPWGKQEGRALRGWLLDRLEDKRFWFDWAGRPTPRSILQMADDVARDPDLVSVLALWEGRPDVPVPVSLEKLLAEEAVPYLAAYRYKDTGLRKREAWEHTWDLQRREDCGEKVDTIPIPPKYTSADFTRNAYWSHRGKLDVPKERFILYPDAGRATDPTPVLGWAGWDHAQQALAIDQLIQQREAEGWEDERLIPLVAGLAELLPWVRQWHAEPDPFYGGVSPAEFFAEQLGDRARQVERTVEQLRAWRPTPARRGRARKAASA